MGQKSNQIERQIDVQRDELGQNLHELQGKVEEVTDWRVQFQKRPMVIIGAAFGGGLLLASMTGRRSRPRRHYREDSEASLRPEHTRGTELQKSKALETFDSIKGALIGVAANTFKDLLGELIPGFRHQLDQTTRAKATSPSSPATPPSARSSAASY
jgi:hypothetical protein